MIGMIKNYLERGRRYRQTFNELAQCTDMELRDLGISRADIHQIATLAMDPAYLNDAEGPFDLADVHRHAA